MKYFFCFNKNYWLSKCWSYLKTFEFSTFNFEIFFKTSDYNSETPCIFLKLSVTNLKVCLQIFLKKIEYKLCCLTKFTSIDISRGSTAVVLSKETQEIAKSVGSRVISKRAKFHSVPRLIETGCITRCIWYLACDHHPNRNFWLLYLRSEISVLLGHDVGLHNNPKFMF